MGKINNHLVHSLSTDRTPDTPRHNSHVLKWIVHKFMEQVREKNRQEGAGLYGR